MQETHSDYPRHSCACPVQHQRAWTQRLAVARAWAATKVLSSWEMPIGLEAFPQEDDDKEEKESK